MSPLMLIGFIGSLAAISICRQPGVKFFSVITFFNYKEKLTPNGAKIYLIFTILLALGIIIKFVAK